MPLSFPIVQECLGARPDRVVFPAEARHVAGRQRDILGGKPHALRFALDDNRTPTCRRISHIRHELELVGLGGFLGLQTLQFGLQFGDLLSNRVLGGLDGRDLPLEVALLGLELVDRPLQAGQFGGQVGLLLSLTTHQLLAGLQPLLQALPVLRHGGEFRLPLLAEFLLLPGAVGHLRSGRRQQLLGGRLDCNHEFGGVRLKGRMVFGQWQRDRIPSCGDLGVMLGLSEGVFHLGPHHGIFVGLVTDGHQQKDQRPHRTDQHGQKGKERHSMSGLSTTHVTWTRIK